MRFRRIVLDSLILIGYVGLIYGTLSITPGFFVFLLKKTGPILKTVIDASIALSILAVILLLYPRLKRKRWHASLGLVIIVSIYALILLQYTSIISEKLHLVEYGFLAYLALRLFRPVRSRDARYLLVIAVVFLAGYFDEFIQRLIPCRVYEMKDVYMNALSGLLGLALLALGGYEDGHEAGSSP